MSEFRDMQRYVAKCAGGEWEESGSWSINRDLVHHGLVRGVEIFLKMKGPHDPLHPHEEDGVADSVLWIANSSPGKGGLEGVAIRTHIREFARDCRRES